MLVVESSQQGKVDVRNAVTLVKRKPLNCQGNKTIYSNLKKNGLTHTKKTDINACKLINYASDRKNLTCFLNIIAYIVSIFKR